MTTTNWRFLLHFVFGVVTVCVAVGCSAREYPKPSDETLIRDGFYRYALPNRLVDENEWRETVYLYSPKIHCSGGPSAPANPLIVAYTDEIGSRLLHIQLDPMETSWNHGVETEFIPIDFSWASQATAELQRSDGVLQILFTDDYGTPVIIGVRGTDLDHALSLIAQLEYVGPDEMSRSPWDNCD